MANRGYAQIFTSIWTDDDFRKLSLAAQHLYFVLLSQADINYAGVLPLTERRWARCCTELSRADVERTIEELADRDYVVVDYDTEELLIRSFMRNDGLWKQPKMLGVALREALGTASAHLRQALARELGRLREALATASGGPDEALKDDRRSEMISEAAKVLAATPDDPIPDPVATPSAGLRAYARATPTPTPAPTPSTDTSTSSPVQVEGGSPDSNARDANSPPPHDARPADRCARHHGTDHDGPCRACGTAREAAAAWDRSRATAEQAQIRSCPWCNADGWRIDPENRHHGPLTPGVRCDHRPLDEYLEELRRAD